MKKYLFFSILTFLSTGLISQEASQNQPQLDNKSRYSKTPAEEQLFQAIFVPSAIAAHNVIVKEKLDLNKIRFQGISTLQWAAFFSVAEQRFVASEQCSLDLEGVLRILIAMGDDINHVAFKAKNYRPDPLLFLPDGYPFLGNAIRSGNFFFMKIAFDTEKMNPKAKLNVHWKDDAGNNFLHMFVDPTNKTIHTNLYAEHIVSRPNIHISDEHAKIDPSLAKRLEVIESLRGGQAIAENKMKVTQKLSINDVVYTFIQRGINVNEQNNAGDTPLHVALRAGYILEANKNQVCKVENGTSEEEIKKIEQLNKENKAHGRSLIKIKKPKIIYYKDFYANAMLNLQLVIRELLAANADINLPNKKGETPLSLAAKINNPNHPIRILIQLAKEGTRPLNAEEFKEKFVKQEEPVSSSQTTNENKRPDPKRPNRYRPSEQRPNLSLEIEEDSKKTSQPKKKERPKLHLEI